MGWEGANVIFDSWVHPLMMGLEEHLIGMFRHDFEFVDGHRSHLGDGAPSMTPAAEPVHRGQQAGAAVPASETGAAPALATAGSTTATATLEAPPGGTVETRWSADGEAELHKIPFFVRSKVRRNTETFAPERGIALIDAETLYDAKAHFSQ
ncbi:MAG: ferredoxin:protochlorophyllide reductase (ATP-dependent) subunit B, partial [Cyanobacteria bacterium]|nr:ferredoxin:protochlorophyllide reductase (ATP-dependent) subunit B [Cyanobacteriota bacterium]